MKKKKVSTKLKKKKCKGRCRKNCVKCLLKPGTYMNKRLQKVQEEARKKLEPTLKAIRECERITGADLAIRINAKAY